MLFNSDGVETKRNVVYKSDEVKYAWVNPDLFLKSGFIPGVLQSQKAILATNDVFGENTVHIDLSDVVNGHYTVGDSTKIEVAAEENASTGYKWHLIKNDCGARVVGGNEEDQHIE